MYTRATRGKTVTITGQVPDEPLAGLNESAQVLGQGIRLAANF
jgi:hypothetical protein